MQAIYTAASGMKNQQLRLDTIADNIANSSTTGYKSTRVDFKDALYSLMDSPVVDSETGNLLTGSGVQLDATSTDFTQGSLRETGSILDFLIKGNGYFTVENPNGEIYYTRNGSFNKSVEGADTYLVTADGYYVLDADGNKIQLPDDTTTLSITDGGVLSTSNGELAKLGIAEFTNPDGLSKVGATCFQATRVSGESTEALNSSVIQGSLENSNVSLAEEMTLLMRSQRAYSMASKALQTADDMDGLANNMH